MKKIIIIETADELVKFANPHRVKDDKEPFLGSETTLIFENDLNHVQLSKADGFQLAGNVTVDEILIEMGKALNIKIHIT